MQFLNLEAIYMWIEYGEGVPAAFCYHIYLDIL